MTTDRHPIGSSNSPVRRFGVVDLMGLVFAVALGLGIATNQPKGGPTFVGQPTPGFALLMYVRASVQSVLMFLMSFSLVLPALGLRPPRPSLRHLMRRPGFVACAAASSIGLLTILGLLEDLGVQMCFIIRGASPDRLATIIDRSVIYPNGAYSTSMSWEEYASFAGMAVFAAWLTLWLCGIWRAEPTWEDRAGRAVGVAWILMLPIHRGLLILLRYGVAGVF